MLEFDLLVLWISIIAGVFGWLLGLGGGIIVIPALTLLFKIDIRYAIGASIVSVIATSSSAAAAYVRERMTNIRVAMVLEVATTSGALTGAYFAGLLKGRWLYIIFAVIPPCPPLPLPRGGEVQLVRRPFLDDAEHGIFATRHPCRRTVSVFQRCS